MVNGYRLIFWGIFFISFHFNLGSLQILPNFIGWAMVAGGITKLGETHKSGSFKKASVLSAIAVFYSVVSLMIETAGRYTMDSSSYAVIWVLFIGVLELLTEYYLIGGSAECFYDRNDADMAGNLLGRFRSYLILDITNLILVCISYTLYLKTLVTFCAILGMILRIWFLIMINGLKKYYMGDDMKSEEE